MNVQSLTQDERKIENYLSVVTSPSENKSHGHLTSRNGEVQSYVSTTEKPEHLLWSSKDYQMAIVV